MDRLLLSCVLLCAFALSGCDREPVATGEKLIKTVPGEAEAEVAAPATRVTRVAAPLPARFHAALPTSSQALAAWREGDAAFPPEAFVADLLALGDAAMFERLAAAAAAKVTSRRCHCLGARLA